MPRFVRVSEGRGGLRSLSQNTVQQTRQRCTILHPAFPLLMDAQDKIVQVSTQSGKMFCGFVVWIWTPCFRNSPEHNLAQHFVSLDHTGQIRKEQLSFSFLRKHVLSRKMMIASQIRGILGGVGKANWRPIFSVLASELGNQGGMRETERHCSNSRGGDWGRNPQVVL